VQFARQFTLDFNRDDLLWGILTAEVANAAQGEGGRPVRAVDKMPYYDEFAEDEFLTDEELALKIRAQTGCSAK
jgi:hypothetical protein